MAFDALFRRLTQSDPCFTIAPITHKAVKDMGLPSLDMYYLVQGPWCHWHNNGGLERSANVSGSQMSRERGRQAVMLRPHAPTSALG